MPALPAPPLLLLRHAEVYAPEPLGRKQLLLGGGQVLWIGDDGTPAPALPGLETVDLDGCWLLPGLIDGHVHVTGGGGEDGFSSRVPGLPLSRYTECGVTSVIGLLGTDDCCRSPRELIAHLYALREQGLGAFGYLGGYHLPVQTLTGSIRGDIALIEPLIGVGELAISDHRSSQPTLDELLRVASEVHVAGMMSGKAGVLHLHLGDGPRGLDLVRRALDQSELPPRVFQPTHVNRRKGLFEEAIELAARGCHVDLTTFPVDPDEDAWPAADAFCRYHEAGAPLRRLTFSSDAGGCLPCFDAHGRLSHMDIGAPGALLATLVELLDRGVALADALPCVTRNVADLLRLPGKGRIAVGHDADLLVLDAERRPLHVLAGGRFHRRDGHRALGGRFEAPGVG